MSYILKFWHKPQRQRALIGLLGLGLFFVVLVIVPAKAGAQDDFVVNISVDGYNQTLRSKGGKIIDLLKRADISVQDNDLVEPALHTEMQGPVFNINIFRARPVRVIDDEKEFVIASAYRNGRLIAENAGIEIFNEDIISLRRIDDFVGAGIIGEELTIVRATPVIVNLYGKRITYRTHVESVGKFFLEKEIFPDGEDYVNYQDNMKIEQGMEIEIVRIGKKVEVNEETIAYRTEHIWDEELDFGVEIEERPGSEGQRVVTYEVEYRNGVETGRETIKSNVIANSQDRILRVGTKAPSSDSNKVLGQKLSAARGWSGEQWICLFNLWEKESRWNHLAQNPRSTAFGIPQFLNGTWGSTGYTKTSDPATQIKAGMIYIENRYGTPCGAWQHSVAKNWY